MKPEQLTAMIRRLRNNLPLLVPSRVARRFVAQANAARDARLFEVAASLLEEALRVTPGNGQLHIQCGHMFKEARDFPNAEAHYREAQRLLPPGADLALQLGHFYKIAGRLEEARTAYGAALKFQPGWAEAQRELLRVGGSPSESVDDEGVVPELLPRSVPRSSGSEGQTLRIDRLGGPRVPSRGSMLKVLRGIEAIRGSITTATPADYVELLVDGVAARRERMQAAPSPSGALRKYVFNIWHDFSDVGQGRHEIAIQISTGGKRRLYREQVLVLAAPAKDALLLSDGFVPRKPGTDASLVDRVNAMPSVVRSVIRTPLPQPVRSILVQRADQLGDLVCSVPAIRRLREIFPEARIVGLLTVANAGLGRSSGLFDEIIVASFEENAIEQRRTMTSEDQSALRRHLHALDLDLAIDLGEGADSRLLLLLSGARFLYGFKDREAPWLSAGLEINGHDPVNGLETMPPSRKMIALVEALGAMHRNCAAPLLRRDLDRASLRSYGIEGEEAFAVLHVGARLAYTRWPGFGALVDLILARTDISIVLLADHPDQIPQFGPSDRVHVATGKLPFDDFEALLAFCAVFVGNDSGPKHLAALRGAKVISLHMARLNWNEWGQEIAGSIISRRVPCAGCAISHNPEDCGKDWACIRHIRPEEVLDALLALLPPSVATA